MLEKVIRWSVANRFLVLAGALLIAAWGWRAATEIPMDAIPDLADVQVVITTSYPGQAPQTVEDQVTYPLTTALLSVPGSTAVRAYSSFGLSYVYVIFKDGTDPYWARSRVLENLAQVSAKLPPGVAPQLGPDASSVGWIFQYALVDRTKQHDNASLRALQDFFVKYELQRIPGVAEVASIGGALKQYQIEINPHRLAAYHLSFEQVANAIRAANQSGGGSVVEMAHNEYMVRANEYLKKLDDFRAIPLAVTSVGKPILLRDVADIHMGPESRRGVADLNGTGEVVGGIVVMRYNTNALKTIDLVKARLAEIQRGLPKGVEMIVTYDRSNLIKKAVHHLAGKLVEECLVIAVVCLVFLLHFRSSFVAILTLPIGIVAAIIVMNAQGISANIMSLGGIAIAVGAMVDAAIVMVENMHKHLERAGPNPDYWRIAADSAVEVGPALFFSLAVATVSFLPVLALTGQEGKLFTPLAYTKTYAMAASAILAVTLTPVLMGFLIRGSIRSENANPISRWGLGIYRPILEKALHNRRLTFMIALVLMASTFWPISKVGTEFMPPLYEGDILYMPTTLPSVSIDEAANILQITDRMIATLPEVKQVFGKAGRAETATDPAPLSMLETTILLKPQSEWPSGETVDELIHKLDSTVRLPGLTNGWGYPIRTRIDMLSTGIRTVLGIKVTGPDIEGIAKMTQHIEGILRNVPGTRDVFGDRLASARYIDVDVNRMRAAQYGVRVADVERLVEGAIGGQVVTNVIDGRERYTVNVRYPRAYRDSLTALRESLIEAPNGMRIPLGQLARVSVTDGPGEIKSENGRLVGYVYIDPVGHDISGYVNSAKAAIAKDLKIPSGYALEWSGQYAQLQHAKEMLAWILPITLLAIISLLYAYFRKMEKPILVLLSLPFALIGGFWLVYILGYQLSVAVAVGFIALVGVAAEFGVVMLLYIDNAIEAARSRGETLGKAALRNAIIEGAIQRVRPKMMTVAVIIGGLLPIMFSHGEGADVMKRIAAPLLGGMVSAPILSMILIPMLYSKWMEKFGKTNQ